MHTRGAVSFGVGMSPMNLCSVSHMASEACEIQCNRLNIYMYRLQNYMSYIILLGLCGGKTLLVNTNFVFSCSIN